MFEFLLFKVLSGSTLQRTSASAIHDSLLLDVSSYREIRGIKTDLFIEI
jgi:hypothetical protein